MVADADDVAGSGSTRLLFVEQNNVARDFEIEPCPPTASSLEILRLYNPIE